MVPIASPPEDSALGAALEAVGDRWTLLVVAALMDGPLRFNDLRARVTGIAPNVLSQRLRQAEQQGLVLAQPYSERPPRFVYELTEAGRGLAGVLRLLADWGARRSESAELPRHDVCGTQLEAHWWCPSCERPVREGESGDLHYA